MTFICSDSTNPNYDGNLSTANAFYRVESWENPIVETGSSTSGTTSGGAYSKIYSAAFRTIAFNNACNLKGVAIFANTLNQYDYDMKVGVFKSVGTVTFTTATPGVVNKTGHGLSVGDVVMFSTTGTLPSAGGGVVTLTAGAEPTLPASILYVSAVPTADTFNVAFTSGGSSIALSGGSGTHTLWEALEVSTKNRSAILGSADLYYDRFYTLTDYKFAGTTAVDTVSSYRLGVWLEPLVATNNIVYLLRRGGSYGFCYYAWGDTQASYTADDSILVADILYNDQNTTLAGVNSPAETGYGVCLAICSGTTHTSDEISRFRWDRTPGASYTLTLKGVVVMSSFSSWEIGTSTNPIPITEKAIIKWTTPTYGTITTGTGIRPAGASYIPGAHAACNLVWHGEYGTLSTTLASNAAASQPVLITTDDMSGEWQIGDRIVVGKRAVKGANPAHNYTISNIVGTTITLSANLPATNGYLAGGPVCNLSRVGIEVSPSSAVTVTGDIVTNYAYAANFMEVEGVFFDRYIMQGSSYELNYSPQSVMGTHYIKHCAFYNYAQTGILFQSYVINPFGMEISNNIAYGVCVIYNIPTSYILNYAPYNIFTTQREVYVHDNIYIDKYYPEGDATNTNSQHKFRFENNSFYGQGYVGNTTLIFTGIGSIYKNNYIYGTVQSTGMAAILINSLLSAGEISGNVIDQVTNGWYIAAFATTGVVIDNCDLTNYTDDLAVGPGAYSDIQFQDCIPSNLPTTAEMLYTVPGSEIRIVNSNNVANTDLVYYKYGVETRTGYGLTDTTVWSGTAFTSALAGQFGLKITPTNSTNLHTKSFYGKTGKLIGNQQNKTLYARCRIKINSATFYAGTHTKPTLRVVYDGTTISSAVATGSTSEQELCIKFSPTTTVQKIDLYLDMATDATGTSADVYVGEVELSLPDGVSIDNTRLSYWSNAKPLAPDSTIPTQDSLWTKSKVVDYGTNSMGELHKATNGTVNDNQGILLS